MVDMGKCEICQENLAKYKCPRCCVATCSVQCVKQHKMDANCSGIRDKAAYVDMKTFNDRHLLNDYRFLEETSRKVDSTTRDDLKRRRDKPNFLKELHRQAKKRKIDLRLMPYPMEKRKNNFTTFNMRLQTILWQIEWIFPKSDTTYIGKRISENSSMRDLIKKYIDPVESDPVCRQKLKEYSQRGIDSCRLFMKVEGRPANSVRYYELDKDKSVKDNLAGKSIVEYPIVCVEFGDCLNYVLSEDTPSTETSKSSQEMNTERNIKNPQLRDCSQNSANQIPDETIRQNSMHDFHKKPESGKQSFTDSQLDVHSVLS